MPRKGENIYRRRDGRWEARYKDGLKPDGRARYRSIYAKSYTEVKAKLLDCRKRHIQPEPRIPADEKLTVKNLMDMWLLERINNVKESSYQCYASLIEKHILPVLGGLPVVSVSENSLNSFIADKLRHGRLDGKGGLSKKTVCDIVFVLKSAIGPYLALDMRKLKTPRYRQPAVDTFDDFEVERIRQAALQDQSLSTLPYLLCLDTGLRLGELCSLRWSDVDLEKRLFVVKRTVLRVRCGDHTRLTVQTPKTESSERRIPITREMAEYLARLRSGAPKEAYVFTGQVGKPLDPRVLQYRFRSFLKKNHIQYRNFHVLRHTFATRCIARGMDAKMLSILLGHADVRITLQLYVHPTMELMRQTLRPASRSPSNACGLVTSCTRWRSM